MIKKHVIWVAAVAALAIGCSSGNKEPQANTSPTTTTPPASTTGASAFADVQPIFAQHCTGCHGENGKGGINLTSHDTVLKGGEEGPIVTPGDPDKSKLVDALRGRNGAKQMPFNQAPLPEVDIKKIEDWIKAGAKA